MGRQTVRHDEEMKELLIEFLWVTNTWTLVWSVHHHHISDSAHYWWFCSVSLDCHLVSWLRLHSDTDSCQQQQSSHEPLDHLAGSPRHQCPWQCSPGHASPASNASAVSSNLPQSVRYLKTQDNSTALSSAALGNLTSSVQQWTNQRADTLYSKTISQSEFR